MFVTIPKFIQVLFPSLIWRKETNKKDIWLTFDDGPDPKATPWILNLLKQENIQATFFLVGEQMEKFPDLVNKIREGGHLVANHSYSHINGWLYNKNKYLSDIEKCQNLMPNNQLFRPPYGKITTSQIKLLKKRYKIILWDVLAGDFQENINPKKIEKNILKNTTKGSIIVLHNNKKSYRNISPILKEIIRKLKQKEFNFSTTW